MLQGDERRRRRRRRRGAATETQREGSTLQEFCWVGVSLMHDQCPPLMSTRCAIQSFSNTPSPVPTVLNTGTKPQWKRYGRQHLDTHKWIFLYKETEREYILLKKLHILGLVKI